MLPLRPLTHLSRRCVLAPTSTRSLALAAQRHSSTSRGAAPPASASSTSATASAAPKAPSAKAKAQASASRALRAQLQAPARAHKEHKKAAAASALAAARAAPDALSAGGAGGAVLPQVFAFASAEAYDLEALMASARLPRGQWELLDDNEVLHVWDWPRSSSLSPSLSSAALAPSEAEEPIRAEVFVFRSGSYVTWGLERDVARRFLGAVVRGRTTGGNVGPASRVANEVERGPYREIGDEEMEFVVQPDAETRIVGDLLIIGGLPPVLPTSHTSSDPWTPTTARLSFSQGLARSARLSVQEASLGAFLDNVAQLPGLLEKTGKVPLGRREVVRKMGFVLGLRQRANLSRDNFFDEPEVYWENEYLAHHYDSICQALDIDQRFRALNEKLDHSENLLGVMRALLTEGSTHRMELIIIALIAFEAAVALISHDYVPSPARAYQQLRALVDPAYELPVHRSAHAVETEFIGLIDSLRAGLVATARAATGRTEEETGSPAPNVRLV